MYNTFVILGKKGLDEWRQHSMKLGQQLNSTFKEFDSALEPTKSERAELSKVFKENEAELNSFLSAENDSFTKVRN